MARVIFSTRKNVVLESENLYTVLTIDGCWSASFTKSSPLAMFAAISEARNLSTYPSQDPTEFYPDVKRISYDEYIALQGDWNENNARMDTFDSVLENIRQETGEL